MNKRYIFNSSMPRSGSELMQCILHQNSTIYASSTSPVLEYWMHARKGLECPESVSQSSDLMDSAFFGFCRGSIDGYYDVMSDRPIICDKSRGWIYYYKWLECVLNQKPKIVCCVRDLREIVSSMERIFQANKHRLGNPDDTINIKNLTIGERVEYWLNSHPVGLSLQRLYDADMQGHLDNVHIVRFEDLTLTPMATIQNLYNYLELPYYEHDFNNIVKVVQEDSSIFGQYGDHNIHSKVEPIPTCHNEILGENISQLIVKNNSWYYDKFYK